MCSLVLENRTLVSHALLMIDEWLHNINYHKFVGCVTLDFRKAFDILSHDLILNKLSLYGCDDITLQWFNSYLKNRSQIVQINNIKSSIEHIKYGVPPGSILGPLIFILFINDIVFEVEYSKLYMYEDDSTLCCYDINVENLNTKLQHGLNKIDTWCLNNKMVINIAKSKAMLVCTHQKRSTLLNDSLSGFVRSTLLENVDSQKILGLIIDKNLTWKTQIEHIHSDLCKLIGLSMEM